MNKVTFIKDYGAKLTFWFDVDNFLQNDSVTLCPEEKINLDQFLKFFVMRYKKNEKFDNRPFEDQKDDPEVRLVSVQEAAVDPKEWGLAVTTPLALHDLKPIPIATDTATHKTLILDTNHHIVNLIHSGLTSGTELPVIRIKGPGLEKIIGDFIVLNRQ